MKRNKLADIASKLLINELKHSITVELNIKTAGVAK